MNLPFWAILRTFQIFSAAVCGTTAAFCSANFFSRDAAVCLNFLPGFSFVGLPFQLLRGVGADVEHGTLAADERKLPHVVAVHECIGRSLH